jgi:hypothetical protein
MELILNMASSSGHDIYAIRQPLRFQSVLEQSAGVSARHENDYHSKDRKIKLLRNKVRQFMLAIDTLAKEKGCRAVKCLETSACPLWRKTF